MNRTDRRRLGYPDGTLDGQRQPLRINHAPVRLGEGRGNGRGAEIVADVQRDPVGKTSRIARKGNDHHRQAAGPHVDKLSQTLRQTGAKVDYGNGDIAVGLGVTSCHGGYGAFVQCQDAVDIGMTVELIKEVSLSRAGIVKNVFHPRRHELLNDKLGRIAGDGSHLHGKTSLTGAGVCHGGSMRGRMCRGHQRAIIRLALGTSNRR